MTAQVSKWWKEGVCYQIWPASYKDSNGDGVGDIPGIIGTLDYLKDLGVDYLWVSPMYDSPLKDMGYDIKDYEGVNPQFGTLEDMDTLIREVHARGMRIILDLVVNHTSDQHKWFQESKKSKDNEYSDWYIWRDPKIVNGERKPPNNWANVFAGSAWEYSEERDQYYLHLFLDSMPDLNWENPVTRRAIYKSAIEFWLKRGVDGFRVDTVNLYCKDQTFPDTKIVDDKSEHQMPEMKHFVNGPRMHEWLKEQRKESMDPYGEDVVLVGEMGGTETAEVIKYIHPTERELNMIFDFDVLNCDGVGDTPRHEWKDWTLPTVKTAVMKSQGFMQDYGAWATVFLSNHDNQRSVSRYGAKNPKLRAQSAKLLALFNGTLSGTLFVYQGEEIGMTGLPEDFPREEMKDAFWIDFFKEMDGKHPGDAEMRKKVDEMFRKYGRDHSRTPVHWSKDAHAGFSSAEPWIKVNPNYTEINVKDQQSDADSVLNYWKRVLVFRKMHKDVLVYGKTAMLDHDNANTMTYTKTAADGRRMLVALNFTDSVQPIYRPPELQAKLGQLIFGNGPMQGDELQPWEGRVYLVN